MLLSGSEGRGCRVACLWLAVYTLNSLTDKLGSESRALTMADISLLMPHACTHIYKHTFEQLETLLQHLMSIFN